MKYFIARTVFNYADEFNIEGFKLVNENEAAMLKDIVPKLDNILKKYYAPEPGHLYSKESYEWYFGTNEELRFDSTHLFSEGFTLTEISAEGAAALVAVNMIETIGYVDAFNLWDDASEEIVEARGIEAVCEDENLCLYPDMVLDQYQADTFEKLTF